MKDTFVYYLKMSMGFLSLYIIIFKRINKGFEYVRWEWYFFITFPVQILQRQRPSTSPTEYSYQITSETPTYTTCWHIELKEESSSFLLLQLAVFVEVSFVCIWVTYLFKYPFQLSNQPARKVDCPSRMADCHSPPCLWNPCVSGPGDSPSLQITLSLFAFLHSWPTFQEIKPGTC